MFSSFIVQPNTEQFHHDASEDIIYIVTRTLL